MATIIKINKERIKPAINELFAIGQFCTLNKMPIKEVEIPIPVATDPIILGIDIPL
jgi:hypothetical protein